MGGWSDDDGPPERSSPGLIRADFARLPMDEGATGAASHHSSPNGRRSREATPLMKRPAGGGDAVGVLDEAPAAHRAGGS